MRVHIPVEYATESAQVRAMTTASAVLARRMSPLLNHGVSSISGSMCASILKWAKEGCERTGLVHIGPYERAPLVCAGVRARSNDRSELRRAPPPSI